LWTDFELFDDPQQRAAAKAQAQRLLRDFSRIRVRESSAEVFTPDDSMNLFRRHADWLEARLATVHAGPTVVSRITRRRATAFIPASPIRC